MTKNKHESGAAIYVITAAILAIITYIEFGLIQYKWFNNPTTTVITLLALSIIKFLMVIAIFMHLKDDNKTFAGFFAVGMFFALATFMAMTLLFSTRSTANNLKAINGEINYGNAESNDSSQAFSGLPPKSENLVLVIDKPKYVAKKYNLNLATFDSKPEIKEIKIEGSDTKKAWAWQELGKKVYNNCSSCHQANGNGINAAFPPLNINAAKHFLRDREYLPKVVLFGLSGEIKLDDTTYNGIMPSWQQLKDEEIAAVLNYVLSSWDNPDIVDSFKPYEASEISELRKLALSPAEVYKERSKNNN